MNKKELTSLKKNFNEECGYCAFNNILTAFVDAKKNIVCKETSAFGILPPDNQELLINTFKKGMSGTLGKNLIEYSFPNAAYAEGKAQSILYKAYKAKLTCDEYNNALLEHIKEKLNYMQAFTIFVMHCTYTLFKKNKNDEKTENTEDYNFIITAICPVSYCEDALIVDSKSNKICKRPKNDKIVNKAPTDAFIFPILTDNEPDANGVICYSAKPKEPNRSVVENVLECTFKMTAEGEKDAFTQVLTEGLGNSLDYSLITRINDKIESEIDKNDYNAPPVMLDNEKVCDILARLGVDDDEIDAVRETFSDIIGDNEISATNVVETKTIINTSDVTVTVKKSGTDKVRVATVGGKKCVIVDIDEANIEVNGILTTV